MFDRENFQTITKLHLERYKILKEAKQYEECIKELEQIITLMSEAITAIFGKPKVNYLKPKPALLEGVKNITLDDVINPDNTITIDAGGNLKIKK